MLIRRVFTLDGPNLWSLSPVLAACIDLQELKDATSTTIPGFHRRLAQWLPALCDSSHANRRPDGFCEQLARGLDLARITNRVSLELQTLAGGGNFEFASVRPTATEGIYHIAFQFEEEHVARACLAEARELVAAAAHDRPYDVETAIRRLHDLANLICLGPSTGTIVNAARKRGIPIRRLDDGSLVQLGHGCRQHRIRMAVSDATRAIGQDIAQDKEVTKSLLRTMRLPVPEGRSVDSADDAWQAATEIGLPVVIKPRNANHGRGVAINLTTREQIAKAYDAALPEGDGVLVENFVLGAEHRLLIVAGRMVAASRGEPEVVVGDGSRSIRALVDELNGDPRRGEDWASPLSIVEIDAPAELMLAKQGFTPASVPAAGASVLIHYNGEFLTDVTDEVHPETAAAAVLAARVVGLDIAGVDMIARDIQQPLQAQGGKIIEVNAGPGLRMHFEPQFGRPRPVGEIIVESMFAADQDGRIPQIAIVGTTGRTSVTRLLRHLLRGCWPQLGIADSKGLCVGDHLLSDQASCTAAAARALQLHPDAQAAILEISYESLRSEGLGFDRCEVAVILNVDTSHSDDQNAAATPTGTGDYERTVLGSLLPGRGIAVLNAQDPGAALLSSDYPGKVVFFADRGDDPVITRHRSGGGQAVIIDNSHIILADGERETLLLGVEMPLTGGGTTAGSVSTHDLLSAVAAAWSLGLMPEELRIRLNSYLRELTSAPSR